MRDPSLREPNGKNRAALGVVVRGDLRCWVMMVCRGTGQCRTCGVACTRAPVKAVKQMGQVRRGKAGAAGREGELGEQEGVLAADLEAAVSCMESRAFFRRFCRASVSQCLSPIQVAPGEGRFPG